MHTPIDQISVGFGLYPSFSTIVHSGAVKHGVPSQSKSLVSSLTSPLDTVKSQTLTSLFSESNNILSSLMSR